MRARDLAGFGSTVGEEPGAADEEPGAAADDASGAGLAACICFGLSRRHAIVNTSTRPQRARSASRLIGTMWWVSWPNASSWNRVGAPALGGNTAIV